jgi:hypothetical protein
MPPVTFIPQIKSGLCGAACAQMILNSQGLIGTSQNDQLQVWSEIKGFTGGGPILPPGATDSSPCESGASFPQKICEPCAPQPFCWCTHPAALQAMLDSYLPNRSVAMFQFKRQDDVTKRVEACIKLGLAPIVLVRAGSHWVVVDEIDPTALYPISLLNPALDAQKGIKMGKWRTHYLQVPQCGKFKDKHVVIGQGA